jgi:hypothetical protein
MTTAVLCATSSPLSLRSASMRHGNLRSQLVAVPAERDQILLQLRLTRSLSLAVGALLVLLLLILI